MKHITTEGSQAIFALALLFASAAATAPVRAAAEVPAADSARAVAPSAQEPQGDDAGRTEPVPRQLEGVGITEHPGAALPLDLTFTDDAGNEVALGEYFNGDRPVVLALVYYSCPMLCNLLLNGLTETLQEIPWTTGEEFEVVAVSINPRETHTLARLKKQNYVKEYGRPEGASGWHFLTGREKNIRALADVVGFQYRYDEDRGEYAHTAAIYACTPEGELSRYLYGVMFKPRTLRLSLVEASDGKIGSTVDQVLLFCYHYDSSSGSYAPAAFNLMRAGGILVALAVAVMLTVLWRREAKKKKRAASQHGEPVSQTLA
jgi:protein SCO1/2